MQDQRRKVGSRQTEEAKLKARQETGRPIRTSSDAGVSQSVAIDILKKAQDIDQTTANSLIQAIPQAPTTPNLPANLGNHVNTTA
jgi:hypothetical protein